MFKLLIRRNYASKISSKCNNAKTFQSNLLDTSGKDIIGPPDPISNMRPIIRHEVPNETPLEAKLRLSQNETQEWNQQFWTKHNNKFFKERKEYISLYANEDNEKAKLTADEMSLFYKSFLDKNWRTHFNYNMEWYKRNFNILLLSFRVNVNKLFRRNKS